MKRRTTLTYILLGIFTLSLFMSAKMAAAASRKELLESFCLSNQHISGGFYDNNNATSDEAELQTSYANAYIISLTDPTFEKLDDKGKTQSFFKDGVTRFGQVPSGNIQDLYYGYMGTTLVGGSVNGTLQTDAVDELLELQDDTSKAFASVDAIEPTIIDTYYAIRFLVLSSQLSVIDSDLQDIAAFTMSCYDAAEGGFAATPSGVPSPLDTYYAILLLEQIGEKDQIDATMKTAILASIEDLYVGDSSFAAHYGGYSLSDSVPYSSLMVTYYCIGVLGELDGNSHPETFTWVLSRQSSIDYGFSDPSASGVSSKSSAILSYYAANVILSFDAGAFGDSNKAVMNEEIWQLSNNPWVIAGIVVGSIALVVIAIIVIYKYKNRY